MGASDSGADALADRLATDLAAALGSDLLTLAAHGSWVSGDFAPQRSDLDLLAVLAGDPDAAELARVEAVHRSVERDRPTWAGRIEVGYVGRDAIRDALTGAGPQHAMLRISPGEPIHQVPVTRHHVLDWEAAHRADCALVGRRPSDVIPAIPPGIVDEVLRDHLRSWPDWLGESTHTGFRAYAVLTVARCRMRLDTGRPLSKRAAARALSAAAPYWAELLGWAERWWYANGSDDDEPPPGVAAFVADAGESTAGGD